MTEQPLVSILMTSWNREKYIADAIESVLASAYNNFELIIVDDGSTDRTVAIGKEYEEKDNRIKVYRNEKNLGQFPNRNKAASLAKGKYLKYVDSDDMIRPDTLSTMVEAMESFEGVGIGLVYGNKEKIEFSMNTFKILEPRLAYLWHYTNGGLLFPGPTGCIYKRELFIKLNSFSVDLGINADVYLNLKMAAVSKTVLFSNELIHWRRHDEQVDQLQQDLLKMQKERYIIDRKILYGESIPLTRSELKKIRLSNKILYIRAALFNFLCKGKRKEFFDLLRYAHIPLYVVPVAALPLRYINSINKSLT